MDKKKVLAIQNITEESKNEIIKLCLYPPAQHGNIMKTLKFIEVLYLCVLFRATETHSDEDSSISDFKKDSRLLTLDSGRLFVQLLKKQIISLDIGSRTVLYVNNYKDFDPFNEKWIINVEFGVDGIGYYLSLLNSPENVEIMESWKDEFREVWLDICLYESLEFLILSFLKYGLVIIDTSRLRQALLSLLGVISAVQCFKAIDEICCLYIQQYMNNKEENKTDINIFVLNRLELIKEQLAHDEFEFSEIGRPLHRPQSVINKVFFNDHCNFAGDEGFSRVP